MLKKILPMLLLSTSLFSYEIQLIKPSQKQVKSPRAKIDRIALPRNDSKEVVFDKDTGLTWQDNIDTQTIKKNRKDARQYCRGLVFAGYKDWYLPRVDELNSIVDKEKNNPAIRTGFKYIKSAHYWTSSPNLSYTKNALNIDFRSGETYHNAKKGICYVRCVRGNYKL
ncbi:MAG: hypothetical protein ACI9TV_002096 [Sulfurimonas sp.]|jgi:hypothetical protein|uniref:Lcl C-terminal domain-containing protein n=1 Tax=Sulfurimonas sp. TaxID=2022749 RepID=UPI0039E37FBD